MCVLGLRGRPATSADPQDGHERAAAQGHRDVVVHGQPEELQDCGDERTHSGGPEDAERRRTPRARRSRPGRRRRRPGFPRGSCPAGPWAQMRQADSPEPGADDGRRRVSPGVEQERQRRHRRGVQEQHRQGRADQVGCPGDPPLLLGGTHHPPKGADEEPVDSGARAAAQPPPPPWQRPRPGPRPAPTEAAAAARPRVTARPPRRGRPVAPGVSRQRPTARLGVSSHDVRGPCAPSSIGAGTRSEQSRRGPCR